MIAGTQALFQWSLRSDVRSFWPHLVRAAFALFMLMSVSAAYIDVFGVSGPGLVFFRSIGFLNVLVISVAGISYFVTAVTEEKDSGTLALLRLAGVTPLAIILGKSTSRLISSLMLLLIQLPFTFLAITLGGITWQQIIASYLALAAYMAFVANMALLCSVRSMTAGRAAGAAAITLFVFYTAHPVIRNGLPAFPKGFVPAWLFNGLMSVADWQESVSVVARLHFLLDPINAQSALLDPQFFWNLLLAVVCFTLSTLLFDRWSDAEVASAFENSPKTRKFTIGRCWQFAVMWKDFLFFTGGWTFFVTKFIAYGLVVAAFTWYQQMLHPGSHWALQREQCWEALLTLLVVLNIEVLLYASGALFSEVRSTTLSSLVMLPTGTVRVMLEKVGACAIALLPVGFWIAAVFLMDAERIIEQCSATMIVSYIVVLLLSSHLTVLLSLYMRWAALPLAVFLTAVSFMCCPILMLSTFSLTDAIARSHNLRISLLMGSLLNLVWTWLFVLLPIEIEIINRWNRLSHE